MKKRHNPRAGQPKEEPKPGPGLPREPAPEELPPEEVPPSELPPGPSEHPEQLPPEVPDEPAGPEIPPPEGFYRILQSDPHFVPAEADPLKHPKNRKRPIERERGRPRDTGRSGA